MRPIAHLALSCGLLLSAGTGGKCLAADPAQIGAVTIERAEERLASMTAADLEKLPVVQITVPFGNGPGGKSATFEEPLLWTVLIEAHAPMFVKPGDQVRQIVTLAGHDGYTALLGLGDSGLNFKIPSVVFLCKFFRQSYQRLPSFDPFSIVTQLIYPAFKIITLLVPSLQTIV